MRYGGKDYLTVHLIQRKGDEKLENGMNIKGGGGGERKESIQIGEVNNSLTASSFTSHLSVCVLSLFLDSTCTRCNIRNLVQYFMRQRSYFYSISLYSQINSTLQKNQYLTFSTHK
jgi:hypothetical protein